MRRPAISALLSSRKLSLHTAGILDDTAIAVLMTTQRVLVVHCGLLACRSAVLVSLRPSRDYRRLHVVLAATLYPALSALLCCSE